MATSAPPADESDPLNSKVLLEAVRRGGELQIEYGVDGTTLTTEKGGPPPKRHPKTVRVKGPDTTEVRSWLAIWAFALLTALVLIPFIPLALGKISVSDLTSILQAAFAGTAGIVGAIVGFYFSGQQAKSQNPPSGSS